MTKLSVKASVLKEQVAKIKSAVEAIYPAVFEQESLTAKDIDISKLTADANGRYEVQLDADTRVKAGFFRGTAKDLDTYDLAFCKTVRDFTMNEGTPREITYKKGEWFAYKLIEPA